MTPLAKSKLKLKPSHAFTFEAIGTKWSIELFETVIQAAALEQAIRARIDQFDKDYSRFRGDSLVTSMSRKAGRYQLPPDAQPLMDAYQQMYELTDGEVTPLIGQALSDAGYDAMYSLSPGEVKAPSNWREALAYDFPQLTIKQPVLLDFGAAGKGYLVDIVATFLREHEIKSYCIDAGGDIAYRSTHNQSIAVGLENPDDPQQAIGVIDICNQSLCGSAGNRRAWSGYHHILSPTKLASPKHIKAVWVLADSTLLADILTTGLYFASADKLKKHYTFEYALVRNDNSLEASNAFKGAFFR